MRDIISGTTRTWPYGTKKTVRIDSVKISKLGRSRVVVCIDEVEKEGYALIEANNGVPPVENTVRVITFTNEGPLGGCWKVDPLQ